MTRVILQRILVTVCVLGICSCQKKESTPVPQAPTGQQQPEEKAAQTEKTDMPPEQPAPSFNPVVPEKQTAIPDKQPNMVPIPLMLPKPQFVGTPENIVGVKNLEKPLGKARPPFLAPEGTRVISKGKPVTGSETEPILGTFEMVVDGDKEASDGSLVEMGPFPQWVMIDLEDVYEIYAIVFWQYHKTERVYYDVIIQVSKDPEFITDVVTLFNNDIDNSSGLGVGEDKHFVGTSEGKLIDAKGVRGRYVRICSNGNNQNDMNHFIEVEVFGKSMP